MEIPPGALAELAYDLLAHTTTGDVDRAADALAEIHAYGDPAALWGLCRATAEAGRRVLVAQAGSDQVVWSLPGFAEEFAGNPPRLFAGRFLTAHANGDAPMCRALYRAVEAAGAVALTDAVCELVATVAGLYRQAALSLDTLT